MIEPGTRLAGRYRLESQVSDAGGSTLWKAIDEILARAVAVRTFEPDFPRIAEAVTAARAASRLTDPRLTQVFDADDSGDSAYVVSEWATGESLEQMLAKGSLEPGRAATLLHEAAEAVAAAHAAGLSHLCLCPKDLLWTTGGTVKLLGIAVDAVLIDVRCEDPGLEDTRALGRMLYASVTGRWPGEHALSGLPEAPRDGGAWRAPRLVQPGVPQGLDTIVCRAVGIPAGDGAAPLNSPAELVAALREVPRTPLPLFAGPAVGPPPAVVPRPQRATPKRPAAERSVPTATAFEPPPTAAKTAAHPAAAQATRPGTTAFRPGGPGRSPALSQPLLAVGAAALTVIAGLGVWGLTRGKDEPKTSGGAPATGTPRPTATVVRLPIDGARAMDEAASGFPGKTDPTIRNTVNLIHDGRDTTIWRSQTYADANFGNYMAGMGVLLDMGAPVTVNRVILQIPGSGAGASVQLKIGDDNSPDLLQKADSGTTTSGKFELTPGNGARRGRYLLLWFTEAPPTGRVEVAEATVFGTK